MKKKSHAWSAPRSPHLDTFDCELLWMHDVVPKRQTRRRWATLSNLRKQHKQMNTTKTMSRSRGGWGYLQRRPECSESSGVSGALEGHLLLQHHLLQHLLLLSQDWLRSLPGTKITAEDEWRHSLAAWQQQAAAGGSQRFVILHNSAAHLYFKKERQICANYFGSLSYEIQKKEKNQITHIEIITDFRSPANGLSCKREDLWY